MRGSVRKRASGRYQATWREKDPVTGKWKQRGETFDTRDEANRYLARVIIDLDEGNPTRLSTTPLREYLPVWLAGRRRLPYNSRRSYKNAIDKRISPYLGNTPLSKLSRDQLNEWVGDLETAGYASRTIEHAYAVLKTALDDAAVDGLIRVNPLTRRAIELPAVDRSPMRILTPGELQQLIDAAAGSSHEALLRFLIASQVRISEALGLNWEDVVFDSRQVRIKHQWIDKAWELADLKSDASVRTLEIDAGAMTALQLHRDRLRFAGKEGAAVFPGRRERLHTSTVRAWLNRLVARADLDPDPPITPHTMRHTGATLMLRARVPIHVVSARLGHADVATTLRHYAHVIPGDDAEAAAVLASLLPLREAV